MRLQYCHQDKTSAMPYNRQHKSHSLNRAPLLSPVSVGRAKDDDLKPMDQVNRPIFSLEAVIRNSIGKD